MKELPKLAIRPLKVFCEAPPGCLTLPSSSEPEALRVLGRERDDDLRHLGIARHLLKLPLTVEQPRPQPPLKHRTASCACDIQLRLNKGTS
jgi:hypothetical protein